MAKNLDAIIAEIEELPTLHQVAVRILQIIDNPKSTVGDINRVVTQDPALASKILKVVNSAYVGLSHKVSNLQQAIVLLGFNAIKGMALSVSVFDVFTETKEGDESFRRDFWIHSITTGSLARQTAQKVGQVDPEVAFVLGLIHDIGKLVLDIYAHEEWRQIMAAVKAERVPFHQAEKKILDTDHADLGGWLAQNWKLSEELVEGIKGHHRESHWKDRRLECVLQYANLVARAVQEADVKEATSNAKIRKVASILGIKTRELAELAQFAKDESKKSGGFLEAMQG